MSQTRPYLSPRFARRRAYFARPGASFRSPPHLIPQRNHELRNLLNVNNVFTRVVLPLPRDDLRAPSHLQGLLLLHHLLVAHEVPLGGLGEAGVGFLDAD